MSKLEDLDMKKVATLFNLFKSTFEESYNKINKDKGLEISIPEDLEDAILEKVFDQYDKHSQRYNIDVTDVCPYKILAWSGYILAENVYSPYKAESQTLAIQSISSAIVAMLKILKIEGVRIEESFHKKALEMVLSEVKGSKIKESCDCQFGLGMNGFYMMFRTASVCEKIPNI